MAGREIDRSSRQITVFGKQVKLQSKLGGLIPASHVSSVAECLVLLATSERILRTRL
jgi:hypothetical protein